MFFRPYFYAICCPLLPSLLRGRRHRAYTKNMKFHWFLWVASQMYLFLAAPEASKFQRARVAKIDGKQAQTKNPRDQKQSNKKTNIFEAKMAPKMDPGDLQKRVRKTVGKSSAQKGLLDASGAAKQSENHILTSSAAIPAFPKGGRKGSGSRDRSPRLPGDAHLSKKTE